MTIAAEAYDEAYDEAYEESFEEGYDEAYDEAVRPGRLRVARPSAPPRRPTDRPVTQAQLQMAIEGVNKAVRTNSAAIATVNRNASRLGREVTTSRRQVGATRRDIATLRDAVVIGPLLASTLGSSNSTLSALLPMMLVSGVGQDTPAGSGSSGGMFGSGGDQSTMIMLLALSGGLGPRTP